MIPEKQANKPGSPQNRGETKGTGGSDAGKGTHPSAWVCRMVEQRGLRVPEKSLYWWSVHLDRFLNYCRKTGPEASEIPEIAAREGGKQGSGDGSGD